MKRDGQTGIQRAIELKKIKESQEEWEEAVLEVQAQQLYGSKIK